MLPRTVTRSGAVALAVAVVVLHLLVLYWPRVTVTGPVEWTDKVVHLAVFAAPTFFVGKIIGTARAATVFAVHAPLSELVQDRLLPGRSGDPYDAVLDLVGVALAVVLLTLSRRGELR